MIKRLIFFLGMATLVTHELDAVANHEWRVLPLTGWLPDHIGYTAFTFLHIPLFAVLIALLTSKQTKVRHHTKIGICLFLIIHALLHVAYMGSLHYEFSQISSNILIFGGAALGALFLIFEALGVGRQPT